MVEYDPTAKQKAFDAIFARKNEVGIRVTIIPAVSDEDTAKMSRRNYRRAVLDKARIFGVTGITNRELLAKTTTEQFLILKTFIPVGWRPASITPWYTDETVDETVKAVIDNG